MIQRCSVGYSKGTRQKKMKFERERLVPWLIQKVHSGEVPGLRWIDNAKSKFRVTWKHAGKPDFELDRDAVLFRMWAEHTGKYKPGEQPDPSTWKTRFRCALRKMPDIEEIRVPHSLDEREPYRVFRVKSRAFKSLPKTQASITSLMDTPSPSPSPSPRNDAAEGLSSCSSFSVTDHQYVNQPMTRNAYVDVFAFPSPDSSHTSSPTHSDISNNSSIFSDEEDSIDNITPTLPPLSSQPLSYSSNDNDFRMASNVFGNGFSTTDTNSELYSMVNGNSSQSQHAFMITDFQTSEGTGYVGGGSGGGMYEEIYNNGLASNVGSSSQYSEFTAQNNDGYSPSFQMGLFLKMLHAAAISMETEALDYDLTEHSTSESNSMNNCFQQMNGEVEQLPLPSSTYSEKVVVNDMCKPVYYEPRLRARIFYDEKEVTAFDLDKQKSTWKLYCGKQEIDTAAVYDQLFGTNSIKEIQLPELPCSNDTQRVLTNFNRGLVLEMSDDGDIWATRKCLTKIFYSCGSKQATKLERDVKAKVFDYSSEFKQTLRESQKGNCAPPSYDVTFTLGWPNGLLVCIVITHAQARQMLLDKQNSEQCISEPTSHDQLAFDLASQLVINGMGFQEGSRQY